MLLIHILKVVGSLAVCLVVVLLFVARDMGKKQKQAQRQNVVRQISCPTCHTKGHVRNITGGEKAVAGAAVGVFALGRISKSMRCTNCGYSW